MKFIPKTLVILIPGFPADESDSTCLPVQQEFIRNLQQQHRELRIVIISVQYPAIREEYVWNNMRVISLNIQHGFYLRLRWIRIWNTLYRLRQENKIAGVLCFWCTEPSIPACWFARLFHIPHFIWIMGQEAKPFNKVIKILHPTSSELVSLSDFLYEEFLKNYKIRPGYVIPLGINSEPAEEIEAQRNIDILGVGSLIPLKQYDLFLQIVKQLTSDFPNLKSVICGKGEQKESLLAIIKDFGMEKNVELIGEIPHSEVIKMMHHAKILLHTSSYEGFGLVCLEALSAGAFVISFHKPMRQQIHQWHIVNNPVHMYEAALELLQDPGAERRSVIPFTMQQTTQKIMDLFGQHSVEYLI